MEKRGAIYIVCLLLILPILQSARVDSQYVPISKRYPGIIIGNSNSLVTVEFAYDPTCEDTADFDQTIRQVIKSFDQKTLSQLTFKYAINALSYHISSFKLSQAVNYVNAKIGPEAALQLLRTFLASIEQWDESSIKNISINQFLNKIAAHVATNFGLAEADVRRQVAHNSITDGQVRKWTKYAMGSLRTPAAPLMFINGALVDGALDMTVEQIASLIKKQI